MVAEPGVLNLVVQGGSFALIAWVFIYWMQRVNGEISANRSELVEEGKLNRAALEKIVDRMMVERESDRQARHQINTTFSETLAKVYTENRRQSERVEEAIRQQTDKLENKLDTVVTGLLAAAKKEAGTPP